MAQGYREVSQISSFDASFQSLILIEGGYANSPYDSGGRTKYGITEALALAHGYRGDMKDLPLDFAKQIYRDEYWNQLNLDKIAALAPDVAHKLFDIGVNCGIGVAARFLKRTLNVLNHGGKDWPDIPEDGPIGPRTLYAFGELKRLHPSDGVAVVMEQLRDQQGVRYIEIAERRPKDEMNEWGWSRRVRAA
jgi:lysozyme family protein